MEQGAYCLDVEDGIRMTIIMDTLEPWTGIRTSHRYLKVGYFIQHFVDQVFYQFIYIYANQ